MTPKLNTLEVQEGKLGRPFRATAVEMIPETEKWFGKDLKHHWRYIFKYIDNGGLFAIELDYNNNILQVKKNYEPNLSN